MAYVYVYVYVYVYESKSNSFPVTPAQLGNLHLRLPRNPLLRRSVFLTLQNSVFHPITVSFRDWFAPAREWSTFSKTGSPKSSFFGVDFGAYLSTVSRKHILVLKLLWILGAGRGGSFFGSILAHI